MIKSHLLPHALGLIDGKWIEADQNSSGDDSNRWMEVLNPANGHIVARVPRMGAAETERAIAAASNVLEAAFSISSDPEQDFTEEGRLLFLKALISCLKTERQELARIITLENGKTLRDSLAEVDYATTFFEDATRHFARLSEIVPEEHAGEALKGTRWVVNYVPTGVAVLLTPWNFPLAMLAKKVSGAIAAGCPFVAKPASETPLAAIALWTLMERSSCFAGARMPRGFANLVMGGSKEIGETMCDDPRVRVVSFTGSTPVGKMLMERCAKTIKRTSMELGGNAPFLVFQGADLAGAVSALVTNKLRASGQTCVCTNRILVHDAIAEEFTAALCDKLKALKPGDGMDSQSDFGPLIHEKAWDKVAKLVGDALGKGAKIMLGGTPAKPSAGTGWIYPATVLTGVNPDMGMWREEIFGPVFAIGSFRDEAEAVQLANGTMHGLAAYVFAAPGESAVRLARKLKCGHIGLNTGSGPIAAAPFGGMKESGIGREGAVHGVLEFCETQVVAEKLS
ncbi:MAG: aldehyde dehydrogenase family protein [Candidatus Methylacidiphilales bacterium]